MKLHPGKLLLLMCFCCTSILFAQTTIFEVLPLEPEGCSLANPQELEPEENWLMEEVPDEYIVEEPELPAGYSSVDEVMAVLSNWLRQENEKADNFLEAHINWHDGLQFYRQENKWGLREEGRRKPWIKPRFDAIIADTAHQGFVGYIDGRCNYYFKNGKAHLSKSYLHIQPLTRGAFIVTTSVGYGLLDEQGDELLPPSQLSIYPVKKGRPHVKVRYEEEKYYWLNWQNGQKTYIDNNYFGSRFIGDRYVLLDQKRLIDLEEGREVFCGAALNIKIVNEEKGYLSISSAEEPLVNYLTNLEGKLLSKEAFAKIDAYLPTGHFVVGYVKDYNPDIGQRILSGVMNEQGEWAVPARYNLLETKLFGGKYLQLTQSGKEIGLVSLNGEEPIERRPYFYFGEEPDGQHLKVLWQIGNEKYAELLNLETGETTALASPGYWKRYAVGQCGTTTVYRALGVEGQMLINAEDEPLLDEPAGFIMKGSKKDLVTIKRKKLVDGRMRNVDEIVDCTGQAIPVEEINTVELALDEDFFYLQKPNGENVFVLPGGQEVASEYNWKPFSRKFGKAHYVLYSQDNFEGLVNRAGEVVLPPIFHSLHLDEANGIVKMVSLLEQKHLQANGNLLFGEEYTKVQYLNYGLFKIYEKGNWGVGRHDGEIILPAAYDNIFFEKGVIVVYNPMGEVEIYDFAGHRL